MTRLRELAALTGPIVVGLYLLRRCNCVFCHFTCTTYLKCCPTCLFCVEEAIKMNENKLIVKKDVELNVNQGAAPHSAEMAR